MVYESVAVGLKLLSVAIKNYAGNLLAESGALAAGIKVFQIVSTLKLRGMWVSRRILTGNACQC